MNGHVNDGFGRTLGSERIRYSSAQSIPEREERTEEGPSSRTSAGYTERAPELQVPPNFDIKPSEPGQYSALDADVAVEYLRPREPKAQGIIGRSKDANYLPPNQAHVFPATGPDQSPGRSPQNFESDVERAVRDMERQLRIKGGPVNINAANDYLGNSSFGEGSPGGMDSKVGAPRLTSCAFPVPASQPGEDDQGGILARMDAFRAQQGKGKKRSGGLKDMWNGEEGYISGNHHQRHGGGLAEMWKEADDAEDGVFPGRRRSSSRRQGTGIREMWTGGDRGTPPGAQPHRQGPGLRALWSGPETAAEDAAKTDAQVAYLRALDRDTRERQAASSNSPQQQRQWPRQAGDRRELSPGDVDDEAGFGASATDGRDRGGSAIEHVTSLAGIGKSTVLPTPRISPPRPWELDRDDERDRLLDKAKKAAYAEELRKQIAEKDARKAAEKQGSARVDPRSPNGNARERVLSPQVAGSEAYLEHSGRISSDLRASPPVARRGAAGQHSPGLSKVEDNHSQLTIARRRLVEDIYGGTGMGVALKGPGDVVHLRTEAGVQGLSETNQRERLQRRAATLEYQRALEEQIAAKSRQKKEDEARRKREDEEEARKQQECMRKMEAEQEEERRRKQEKEKAQLDSLYRQQEEALRKKRGGNNTPLHRLGAGTSARDNSSSIRVQHAFSGSPYQDRMSSHAQYLTEIESSSSHDSPTTPRSRGVPPDVNDLPAGAQARAQSLRSSPSRSDPPATSSSCRPRSACSGNPAGGNFTPMTGRLADVCTGLGSSVLLIPSDLPRSARALDSKRGAMRREVVSGTYAGDNRCAKGVTSTAPSAFPVGRRLPSAVINEAPLRTRSAFVPVESTMLFPEVDYIDPAPQVVLSEGDSEMSLARGAGGDGDKALVGASHATGFASRDSPHDEIDAFISSWQDHKGQSHRESLSAELAPHQVKTASGCKGFSGRPTTVAESAPFDGRTDSRAPNENRGGYGPGSDKEVGESGAMASRMMGPSTPLPPPVDEDARRLNHEPEQPLESDSMLLYPTWPDQQELPGTLKSPPRIAAGVGSLSSAEREVEDEMSPLTRLLAETSLKLPIDATAADYGAAHLPNSFPVGSGDVRVGSGGGVNGDGSSDPSVAMTARRPRAVWETRARGGNAVAEALKCRGGGTPWEEITDVRSSYPGP